MTNQHEQWSHIPRRLLIVIMPMAFNARHNFDTLHSPAQDRDIEEVARSDRLILVSSRKIKR